VAPSYELVWGRALIGSSMIRKSGSRFSEKIMLLWCDGFEVAAIQRQLVRELQMQKPR